MSVITPAFPCMNSSHMITDTTLEIITNFFKNGYKMISIDILKTRTKTWSDLFKKFDFFNVYFLSLLLNNNNNNCRSILILLKLIFLVGKKERRMNLKLGRVSSSAKSESFITPWKEATFSPNWIIIIWIFSLIINSLWLITFTFTYFLKHTQNLVFTLFSLSFLDSKFEQCKAMFYGVKAKDLAAIKNKKFDFVTSVQDFCL